MQTQVDAWFESPRLGRSGSCLKRQQGRADMAKLNTLAMLHQTAIGAGIVVTVAVWIFYFWLKRAERKN